MDVTPDPTDALTLAEKSCRAAVERRIGGKVYRFTNPGDPDCAVFDIGHMQTGDLAACRAKSYHWRGSLEIYRRDHDALQRAVMSLLASLPVNLDLAADDELLAASNVKVFRVAPESGAVGDIKPVDVQPKKDDKPIVTCAVSVAFDIVFTVG